jgi:hypothetical protein
MKKDETASADELRPEYDLRSLRVRKLGSGRKSFDGAGRLESGGAEGFPNPNRAIRDAIEEEVARWDSTRLAHECAKLDPTYEQAWADEGFTPG